MSSRILRFERKPQKDSVCELPSKSQSSTFGEIGVGTEFQFVVNKLTSPVFVNIDIAYRDDSAKEVGLCNCVCVRDGVREWLPDALPVVI